MRVRRYTLDTHLDIIICIHIRIYALMHTQGSLSEAVSYDAASASSLGAAVYLHIHINICIHIRIYAHMHTQGSLSEAVSYDAASVSSLGAANAPTTGGVLMRVAGAGCAPRIAARDIYIYIHI